jgi:hypothetical protein
MIPEYSQGVCGDGAAILKDGVAMTVDEIVAELNGKPEQTLDLGAYRHKDGCLYEVLSVGRNSDDAGQQMVVYVSLEDSEFPAGTLWTKPLREFKRPGRFFKVETSVGCTWESGNEPCPKCPRKITCLHKCLLLQDELKQVTGDKND